MPTTLYTIGFTKSSAEHFFGRLQQAGVRRLVDIRLNNTSNWPASPGATTWRTSCARSWTRSTSTSRCSPRHRDLLKAIQGKQIGWDEYARAVHWR